MPKGRDVIPMISHRRKTEVPIVDAVLMLFHEDKGVGRLRLEDVRDLAVHAKAGGAVVRAGDVLAVHVAIHPVAADAKGDSSGLRGANIARAAVNADGFVV